MKHEHLLKIKFLRTAPNYELFRPTYSAHSMVRIKFVPKIAIFIVKFTSYINIQRRGFLTLHGAADLIRINSSPQGCWGGGAGGRLNLTLVLKVQKPRLRKLFQPKTLLSSETGCKNVLCTLLRYNGCNYCNAGFTRSWGHTSKC